MQKKINGKLIAIIAGLALGLFLVPGCNGDKKEQKLDSAAPYADTNADKGPGMTQQADEAELKEEDKQKATGSWVQMQSGEVYARLECKYESGSIHYSLFKGNETKASVEGTASNVNDSEYFNGDDMDCPVDFRFDKEKFTVEMKTSDCKKSTMDFNGVYTRK